VEPIVPLISSTVAGPLGAMHLPRLWLKILLHAVGRLPEGYRHGEGGFDSLTISNLGIDGRELIAYVERELPSYLACEAWVREHATKLDGMSIAAHNRAIVERDKPEDLAAPIRATLGLPATLTNSVALNDLDDWALAHDLAVATVA
jgi:hypothetical protein